MAIQRRQLLTTRLKVDPSVNANKTSGVLWRNCTGETMACVALDWVLGLGTGASDDASFRDFVIQDEICLKEIIKVIKSTAVVKAPESSETNCESPPFKEPMLPPTLTNINRHIQRELILHRSLRNQWAVGASPKLPSPPSKDKSQVAQLMSKERRSLLKMIQGMAEGGTLLVSEMLAVLSARMRLFGFLGKVLFDETLLQNECGSQNPFTQWVCEYNSSIFSTCAADVEASLNKLADIERVPYKRLFYLYRSTISHYYAIFKHQSAAGEKPTPSDPNSLSRRISYILANHEALNVDKTVIDCIDWHGSRPPPPAPSPPRSESPSKPIPRPPKAARMIVSAAAAVTASVAAIVFRRKGVVGKI